MHLEQTLLKLSNLAYQLKDKLAELDISAFIVLPEGHGSGRSMPWVFSSNWRGSENGGKHEPKAFLDDSPRSQT